MSKLKYKIIDNFLSKEDFLVIKNAMTSNEFSWHLEPNINMDHINLKNDFSMYLTHLFYYKVLISGQMFLLKDLIKKIEEFEKEPIKSIIRIKGNLYPHTEKIETHKIHFDYPFKHKGAIFYINTNNGKTILEDGTKIDSIENRILLFEPYKRHSSTSTNNQKYRMNINFNYF